jgi:hypothetical protein
MLKKKTEEPEETALTREGASVTAAIEGKRLQRKDIGGRRNSE